MLGCKITIQISCYYTYQWPITSRTGVLHRSSGREHVPDNGGGYWCISRPLFQSKYGGGGGIFPGETLERYNVQFTTYSRGLPPIPEVCHLFQRFATYSVEGLQELRKKIVTVQYWTKEASLPLLVVEGNGAFSLGINWLVEIKLNGHPLRGYLPR